MVEVSLLTKVAVCILMQDTSPPPPPKKKSTGNTQEAVAPSGLTEKLLTGTLLLSPKTNKQIIKNEMCCSGLASFSTIVQSFWSRRCLVATGSSILLKNKGKSKESRVRAIENNHYVNGSTDTGAGADCRFIIRLFS